MSEFQNIETEIYEKVDEYKVALQDAALQGNYDEDDEDENIVSFKTLLESIEELLGNLISIKLAAKIASGQITKNQAEIQGEKDLSKELKKEIDFKGLILDVYEGIEEEDPLPAERLNIISLILEYEEFSNEDTKDINEITNYLEDMLVSDEEASEVSEVSDSEE